MTIPERLYKLAKGKIGEIREMFDNQDAEIDPEILEKIQRSQARKTARQELSDAIDGTVPAGSTAAHASPAPRTTAPLRSPDEISGGAGRTTSSNDAAAEDALAPHYRLLGLEPGTDFSTVQAVYEKLSERCRASRFTPGSPEALEAQDIETRLEATYKVLREQLDPTARRFDMLEI